jgi:hypothetical protein
MRRLIFLTQSVDPAHPVLAATIPKIRALAARVDEVVVLAQSGGGEGLPSNVDVRTFGAATQLGRAWRFERELAQALAGRRGRGSHDSRLRPAGCAACASAPYPARPLVHALESLADVACRRATGDGDRQRRRRSFPLESAKVRGIGHGIDVNEFACTDRGAHAALRALVLGRYSPAKGIGTILRGVQQVDGVEVKLHGVALNDLERRHRGELEGSAFLWVMRYRVSAFQTCSPRRTC